MHVLVSITCKCFIHTVKWVFFSFLIIIWYILYYCNRIFGKWKFFHRRIKLQYSMAYAFNSQSLGYVILSPFFFQKFGNFGLIGRKSGNLNKWNTFFLYLLNEFLWPFVLIFYFSHPLYFQHLSLLATCD